MELADALARHHPRVHQVWLGMGSAVPAAPRDGVVHLQFTDNLWGADAASAARSLLDVRREVPGPVVVTLHDVPDPTDDPGRWERRRRAYAAVADAADHVVVNSWHERRWVRDVGAATSVAVVPNPVPLVPPPTPAAVRTWTRRLRAELGRDRVVGLLGWVHPGKRYDLVLEELAGRRDLGVALLGAPSPGHEPDVAALRRQAVRLDLALVVTGWLPSDAQSAAMRAVDHAVVSHPRPSASGSATAWLAAGVVPLVRTSDYARELRARGVDLVETWDPAQLAATLDEDHAVRPRGRGTPPGSGPTGPDCAADGHEFSPSRAALRHLDLYRSLA